MGIKNPGIEATRLFQLKHGIIFDDINTVHLVNGSKLTMYMSVSKPSDCFFVLFFVPWCPFSIKLAPIFNALPRAFDRFDILAFDISKSVGY